MAGNVCPIRAMEDAEYGRTRDYVIRCANSGYHAPYNNIHDDAGLSEAYCAGFHDGLAALAKARGQ